MEDFVETNSICASCVGYFGFYVTSPRMLSTVLIEGNKIWQLRILGFVAKRNPDHKKQKQKQNNNNNNTTNTHTKKKKRFGATNLDPAERHSVNQSARLHIQQVRGTPAMR